MRQELTMEQKNDGGPAFPFTPNPQPHNSDGTWCQNWDSGEPGMTLRDWFAGKALSGILAESFGCDPGAGIPPPWQTALAAERAYRMADAMLSRRVAP